jgi:hypothetical protein
VTELRIVLQTVWGWFLIRAAALRASDRNAGVVMAQWVVLTALGVAAAIAVAAAIFAKVKSAANNIQLK